MTSANVKAIQALEELRTALMRFKSDTQRTLQVAEGEINRTKAWLQERLTYWQRELQRRQRELQEAQGALRTCQAQSYRDPETGRVYVPDCSREQAVVRQAQHQVEQATTSLRTVQYHMRKVEEAATSYKHKSVQLERTLESDLLKASDLLSKSAETLWSYVEGG